MYTCIRINLKKGRTKMAAPKPNRTKSADFLFWLQKTQKSCSQNRHNSSPCQDTKVNRKIRESILDFTALWGEINPDMPYLCRRGLSGAKKAFLPLSPSVWRKAMKKNVKSSIFDEKTSKFSRLLSFKISIICCIGNNALTANNNRK